MNPRFDDPERPARILIVDDEADNRRLLEVMLGPDGYLVLTAASGDEALAMIAQQEPDLVLLDIMMPGMNGYEVAKQIKDNVATKPIPIIMITVLEDRDALMLGLAAGVDDFLTKPVNRGELLLRVRNLLRLKAYGDYYDKYSHMLEGEVDSRSADLVESERLYRSTFDAAPVGIVHVGLDGGCLRVNQHLCDLLGYTRDELRSIALQDLFHAEDASEKIEALHQMVSQTVDRHVVEERRYRRKDGTFLWTRANTSVHRDSSGQAQHLISVIEDISDRRALEAQIRQSVVSLTASEQRYRTLVESANDAIAVLTPEGVVREVNQRWVAIVGLPRRQLVGRNVRDFAPSGKEDETAQMFDQTIASNATRSTPLEIATSDGSTVLMEFSSTAIDVAGERLVLMIGRDVTEQRQLEKQLRQAQKLEVLGQLAGGVAHDFNNLLTVVLGSSEVLLLELAADDPSRIEVLEIKKAGERATGLTQQLLAFSRKQVLQPSLLDFNELLSGMEPLLRRLIATHVDLVVRLGPTAGTIKIDPTQLEQLVVNLVVNAADAMPRGGKLTIETSHLRLDESYRKRHLPVAPGDYIMLAVSDTGVGMDEATSQRIFEPFFTTKEVGKGTGLGLATVYGIVKQSGGDIWVYSEPGHGTVFKIYLPQVAAAASAAIKVSAASEESRGGSETILLVEDDEAVRRLARLSLERSGYSVVDSANPKEALRAANQFGGQIDLLLSDVVMPESEGLPLFQRLAEIRPSLRVLYMSGYADEAVIRHGIVVEGTPFLQKPFTPFALSAKVRAVLDGPWPTAATVALREAEN
jgi:two-component system, cell cycle sensor histidine kinase and response regulator CckA